MRLVAHCCDSWPRRLRPHHNDHFLMDYFPRPLEGGPPLLPYARRPPRAPSHSVPLAAPQRSRPPSAGSGRQGALCLEHGAPSCARCRSLGWGINRCCRVGHTGHTWSSGGSCYPIAPPRVAPGRQVLVPEARRAGAAALSSWLGRARPASQALPDPGPPAARRCAALPRLLGTRPSPALGPHASRPAKRQAPNRPDRGDPGGVSHRTTGGGGSRPPITPANGGGGAATLDRPPRLPPPMRGPWGHHRVGGQQTSSRPGQRGGAMARGRPPSSSTGAGVLVEPAARQDPPLHPPPLAERLPPSLPDVFSRISAALSSRAPLRRPSPPQARRRPQPGATRSVADMLRARPPPPPHGLDRSP